MKKRAGIFVAMLVAVAMLFGAVGCGEKEPSEEKAPTVNITSGDASITTEQSYTLAYTTTDANTVTVTFAEKDGGTAGAYDESTKQFTAAEAGEYTLTVTAKNVEKTASASVKVTVTLSADGTEPVISFENKQESYTVAVDEEITLPKATASDERDGDLTGSLEVAPVSAQGVSFQANQDGTYSFIASVAGTHKISYYVADAAGNEAEEFIDVTVTPATAETELAAGEGDITNLLQSEKTYTENFASGYNSAFAKGLTYDANVKARIVGGEAAIAGNSLIMDFKDCGPTTDTKFYFGALQNYLRSGKWTISMDVKVVQGKVPGNNLYMFFIQEGQTQAQDKRYSIAADGTVTHLEFEEIKTFDTSNPWYFGLFCYTGDGSFSYEGLQLAIDNISFTYKLVEDATVTRTQEPKTIAATDLDGGYTFTGSDSNYTEVIGSSKAIYLQKSKLAAGDYLTNEQYANVTAENGFNGDCVVYTTGQITAFKSLKDLCVDSNYDYTLTLSVYLPSNISGWYFWATPIADASSNGSVLKALSADDMKAGVHTWTVTFTGKSDYVNIGLYSGNASAVFIGDIQIARTQRQVTSTTPKGYEVGKTWTLTAANKLTTERTSVVSTAETTLADGTLLSTKAGFEGENAILFDKSNNVTGELFRLNEIVEANCEYKVTLVLYVESVTGTLMLNYDNRDFPAVATETGLKTVELTITSTVDFFSFYVNGSSAAKVYLASVKIELTKIN